MSVLRTNTIEIRGQSYTVQELSGKQMASVRRLLADDAQKHRVEAFMAFCCTLTPKFKDENEASEESHAILSAISGEVFRLSKDEASEPGKA